MNTRILRALKTGQDFTANQLRSKFGIRRVSDRISEIRAAGYPVYLNTKTTANGEKIRVYRLGTAPRAVVAHANFVATKGYEPYSYELQDRLAFVK